MASFADRVKAFNRHLEINTKLPKGVGVVNPYKESKLALRLSDTFYEKYYQDHNKRLLILGISPGRFGTALSGIPFTDFKRLEQYCSISAESHSAHEPSSEFVYKMIGAIGSVEAFYRHFFINSVCPLGFVKFKQDRTVVNYNYYDDAVLFNSVRPFTISSIRKLMDLGCYKDVCYCMGIKNGRYQKELNQEYNFFERVEVLPHPRYIVQYKRKQMAEMIALYRSALNG